MSSIFAKLNLRPQERRLVVFIAIVLFVVLNIAFVWPHFGDWGKLQTQRFRSEKTLAMYKNVIAKEQAYRVRLRELESAGSAVLPEEQALDLVRIVNEQASRNRLTVSRADPRPRISTTYTNSFFEEQYVTIQINTGNEELVNFLVSLTSTNSLIRVREMVLKADASGFKLVGDITLVASYQKSPPVRPQSASASPAQSLAAAANTPVTRSSNPAAKAEANPKAASQTNQTSSLKAAPSPSPPN
jgi:Tfp pilus assembly protein PilO